MDIRILEEPFSIAKVEKLEDICMDDSTYLFIGKTQEEVSVVCATANMPNNVVEVEHGWRCLKIEGQLDFSLIGILAKITTILANEKIGVFVVSTFNTDYVLVKAEHIDKAKCVLQDNAYSVW